MNFRVGFPASVKAAVGIFMGVVLSLKIASGSAIILPVLSLPVVNTESSHRFGCLFCNSL